MLYNVCKNKKKKINFEQYARLHLDGPKFAICETASNAVFVLNSSFTTKDNYFRVAIDEACDAFNKVLFEFGYTQKIEVYDPKCHQTYAPQQHPLYKPQKTMILFADFHLNIETLHLLQMNVVE